MILTRDSMDSTAGFISTPPTTPLVIASLGHQRHGYLLADRRNLTLETSKIEFEFEPTDDYRRVLQQHHHHHRDSTQVVVGGVGVVILALCYYSTRTTTSTGRSWKRRIYREQLTLEYGIFQYRPGLSKDEAMKP